MTRMQEANGAIAVGAGIVVRTVEAFEACSDDGGVTQVTSRIVNHLGGDLFRSLALAL